MNIKKLGVNIDHVATIRNARGEFYPNPSKAALIAQKSGANSVTIHLREDRRHIRDYDLKSIRSLLKIPLNLEIAPTNEMLKIALRNKPKYVCIVPEKRNEITTEGGLNVKKKFNFLKKMVKQLHNKKIRVSFFIEPKISDIKLAKLIGVDCVEIHTGKYCNLFNNNKNVKHEFKKIKNAAKYASEAKLEVHAGHGLTYKSAYNISRISYITEFNIGHFIIAEAIFITLRKSIKKFKNIINI